MALKTANGPSSLAEDACAEFWAPYEKSKTEVLNVEEREKINNPMSTVAEGGQ